jgi:hypothetical protein
VEIEPAAISELEISGAATVGDGKLIEGRKYLLRHGRMFPASRDAERGTPGVMIVEFDGHDF